MMNSYIESKKAWLIIALLFVAPILLTAAGPTLIDLTANVKNILPHGNGGTDSAYFSVAGPTAARTYTFPDANKTIMATDTAVAASQLPAPTASTIGGVESKDCSTTAMGKINTDGTVTCLGSLPGAINFADAEVPSGTPNGVLTAFGLAHTPNPAASLLCGENGLVQEAAGNDFTLSTATVTYGVAPPTGTRILCWYRY